MADSERMIATARQVADLITEVEGLRDELNDYRSVNESVRVCADHTTEVVDGPCLVCEVERLRSRLAEVGQERDLLREATAESVVAGVEVAARVRDANQAERQRLEERAERAEAALALAVERADRNRASYRHMLHRAERAEAALGMWPSVAARWACCHAGLKAAPDPCPWHGDGVRAFPEVSVPSSLDAEHLTVRIDADDYEKALADPRVKELHARADAFAAECPDVALDAPKEWRAVARDSEDLTTDWEGPFTDRDEAEQTLAQMLVALPPYDEGWIEWRSVSSWTRVVDAPKEQSDG